MAKKKESAAAANQLGEVAGSIGEMAVIRIRFIGMTPLLQQSAALPLAVSDPDAMGTGRKDHLSGAEEAEYGAYKTDDGRYYHPGAAFRDAAIDAVTGIKIGKKAAPGLFTSGFFNITEQAILIDPKTLKPLKQYAVDTRNVVNPNTGGMVPRSRPRWDVWACEVEFEYDPSDLSPANILTALNISGARVGVGQLRPLPKKKNPKKGKGGRYGKYRAEIVK